ncbi:hypothetical protein [Pseudoteredinibacter isoporae]|uniref:hypothetical protein n=1 Tax=Pseudoteredinibacter isoporae TaxID=570281 RepID=UPI00310C8073
MNALCPQHQQALLSNPKQALHACRKLIEEGTQSHHAADYQTSCQRFQAGIEISQMLLAQCPCPAMITMRVIAGHNLSASYVAQGRNQYAENTLYATHEEICALCQDGRLQRCVRLEALSQLKTTLFSLTSQLGYMGKSEHLHDAITEAEAIAECTAQQLFH